MKRWQTFVGVGANSENAVDCNNIAPAVIPTSKCQMAKNVEVNREDDKKKMCECVIKIWHNFEMDAFASVRVQWLCKLVDVHVLWPII